MFGNEEELERARISYEEQMAKKLDFDTVLESWFRKTKVESMGVGEEAFSPSRKYRRSQRSKVSYSSSVSSLVIKRKEEKIAKLKTKQLLRQQEF